MSLDTEAIRERLKKNWPWFVEPELVSFVNDCRNDIHSLCSEVDELRYRLKGAHEKIRQLMSERDRAEDELRASKSQGAV